MFTQWLCSIILINCLEIAYLAGLYLVEFTSFEFAVATNILADAILFFSVIAGLRPQADNFLHHERKELWIFQLIVAGLISWGAICFSFGSKAWNLIAVGGVMGFAMAFDAMMILRFCYKLRTLQNNSEFELKEFSNTKNHA